MQRELFRPALIFPGRRWERQQNYLSHNDIFSDVLLCENITEVEKY